MPPRRRFLELAGIAGLNAAAVCLGAPATDGDGTPTTDSTPTSTPAATASFDFGDWFADTSNYDGRTRDRRGRDAVTVRVGAAGNGGQFAFDPPAIWIEPDMTEFHQHTGM